MYFCFQRAHIPASIMDIIRNPQIKTEPIIEIKQEIEDYE